VRAAGRTLADAVDGRDVAIGRRGVRALETRGHTVGGTCYLADGYVVTGDVLFVGGCGRTDFTGGDTAEMWQSLQRLMRLPEETRVYPGHNYGETPTSSIGHETRTTRTSAARRSRSSACCASASGRASNGDPKGPTPPHGNGRQSSPFPARSHADMAAGPPEPQGLRTVSCSSSARSSSSTSSTS
jgi:glyoxylase-like metal-dependent hydrolase (beta-lactamase superfamily II)